MITVEAHLEDAILALLEARDRAELFQYGPKEIAQITLLIRATHKVRKEIVEREACSSNGNSKV